MPPSLGWPWLCVQQRFLCRVCTLCSALMPISMARCDLVTSKDIWKTCSKVMFNVRCIARCCKMFLKPLCASPPYQIGERKVANASWIAIHVPSYAFRCPQVFKVSDLTILRRSLGSKCQRHRVVPFRSFVPRSPCSNSVTAKRN